MVVNESDKRVSSSKEAKSDQDKNRIIVKRGDMEDVLIKATIDAEEQGDNEKVKEKIEELMHFYEEALKSATSWSTQKMILNAIRCWRSRAIYKHIEIPPIGVTIPTPSPRPEIPPITEEELKNPLSRKEMMDMIKSAVLEATEKGAEEATRKWFDRGRKEYEGLQGYI